MLRFTLNEFQFDFFAHEKLRRQNVTIFLLIFFFNLTLKTVFNVKTSPKWYRRIVPNLCFQYELFGILKTQS